VRDEVAQAPAPAQIAATEQSEPAPVPAPAVGEEYVDQEYAEPRQSDDLVAEAVDADFVDAETEQEYSGEAVEQSLPLSDDETAAAESGRADLLAGVDELLNEKFGDDKIERAKFLKSRVPSKLETADLQGLYDDLRAL